MAHILIMPRQGNTVESCIVTDWKVKTGDVVAAETIVCEVETDKATFEIPAGKAGTVLALLCESGDDVPVLSPIAVIGEPGEAIPEEISNKGTETQKDEKETPRRDAETQRKKEAEESTHKNTEKQKDTDFLCASVSPCDVSLGASPRARNLAAKEAMPLEMLPELGVTGSGPGGRIIERDVTAALQNRSPLTAAAKAVGGRTIPAVGSGIGGRVTTADLAAGSHFPATPQPQFTAEGKITETPIKGIRKIIADRMFLSLAESAQFTLNSSASAVKLQEIRSRIKIESSFAEEQRLSKISVNDLILFAVSRTLPHFPFMNAHKTGDSIKTFERVHLAVAVDTPRGLMVPVIRNANLLSLTQISSEAKRLAAACQNGTANPDELSGSTFTVSNLGNLGITSFTPVLNTPEVAILGVCGIEMKTVARLEGEACKCKCDCGCDCCCSRIHFEPQIGFSLTINHQAVDGAPAARFLKALGEAVAHIDLLLAAG